MEEGLTAPGESPASSDPRWSDTPGSLRALLLRLDGQVGAVVTIEKHVVDSASVSGELARQLGRIAQQMDLSAGYGAVEPASGAPGFGPMKLGFTREAASIRRQMSER